MSTTLSVISGRTLSGSRRGASAVGSFAVKLAVRSARGAVRPPLVLLQRVVLCSRFLGLCFAAANGWRHDMIKHVIDHWHRWTPNARAQVKEDWENSFSVVEEVALKRAKVTSGGDFQW